MIINWSNEGKLTVCIVLHCGVLGSTGSAQIDKMVQNHWNHCTDYGAFRFESVWHWVPGFFVRVSLHLLPSIYILWRGLTLTKVNIDGELQFSNVAISILGQWILHNSKIFDHQLETRLGNICFQKRFWGGDLDKYPSVEIF